MGLEKLLKKELILEVKERDKKIREQAKTLKQNKLAIQALMEKTEKPVYDTGVFHLIQKTIEDYPEHERNDFAQSLEKNLSWYLAKVVTDFKTVQDSKKLGIIKGFNRFLLQQADMRDLSQYVEAYITRALYRAGEGVRKEGKTQPLPFPNVVIPNEVGAMIEKYWEVYIK